MKKDKMVQHKKRLRRKKALPFYRPSFGRKEELEIIDTLRSGWVGRGPKTEAFEEDFKRYVQSRYALGVNSCTAGLDLSLMAIGIGKGDEVITTPMTFPATANVIVHQGARPVFVDIKEDTFNIDPDKIEEKISSRTKAIIPVHFAGHPSEMEKLLYLAKRYNLFIIEDAAHALGSEYQGKKIGSIGDLTCFSFYATKNITTGEGGMVTTNNKEFANKMRLLSLHGLTKDAWERKKNEGFTSWDAVLPGFKYNMYDLQASLGLVQLRKIEKFREIRKRYTQMYNELFLQVPEVITPVKREGVRHAYHLYVVMIKIKDLTVSRKEIIEALWKEKIEVGLHFRALHLHPFYRKVYSFKRGDFPIAEYVSDRVISLPLYPKMTEKDVEKVALFVKRVIAKYRK